MSLREPVEVVDAREVGPVHFVAIGGAGMSGIAQLFHELGVPVSGSDQVDSPTLRQLTASGITTHVGHDASYLGDAQTVVVSSAVRETNPELAAARERGLRVWHRSAALAALMVGRHGVCVAGTHGKTTTSGMTATMLAEAGADPTYVIGSPLSSTGESAHLGHGGIVVIEADESDGSFLQYPTEIAVITNIEADHLDNWGSPEAYFAGFERFASQPGVRAVVISADDPGALHLAERLRGHDAHIVTFGEATDADVRLSALDLSGIAAAADLTYEGTTHRLQLQVPGRYNLGNAAAAFAAGRLLGVDAARLVAGARNFGGTLRRFQLVGEVAGTRIFDDYAHHPTEIRATLNAARRVVAPGGRLVACFQPHLYSRTMDFAREFGEALALADVVVLTDIYAAREDPVPGVTGELIRDTAQHAGAAEVHYVADKADLPGALAGIVRPDDVVLTIGAGDVTLVGPLLVAELGGARRE